MHPIERLRAVARASGADQRVLVRETAAALRSLGADPAGLVTSARRIVQRHPGSGALWWLCSQVLTAPDPLEALRSCVHQVDADRTVEHLVRELPEGATVCLAGWPDLIGDALVRRGDLAVLIVDSDDESAGLARMLTRAELDAELVEPAGAASAASWSDVVLVEALMCGPTDVLASRASRALAAGAASSAVPVWAVAGVGRRLPAAIWEHTAARRGERGRPWELEHEEVPSVLVSHVVSTVGVVPAPGDLAVPECGVAHELLRGVDF